MNKNATPEGGPQGNLGSLGTLAALQPELLERILSLTHYGTKLQLNRTCKGLHAALLGRKTKFDDSDWEPCTHLYLETTGDPAAASRALQMAAHAAHEVTLHVFAEQPAEEPPASAPEDPAWLETVLQPWLNGAGAGAAAEAEECMATAALTTIWQPPSLWQIKSIRLVGLQLSHPFPACIGQAFPNLQQYTLDHVQWPLNIAAAPTPWQCLESLEIVGPFPMLPRNLRPDTFPSLNKLSFWSGKVVDAENVMAFCAASSQQLTCLELELYDASASVSRLFSKAHFPLLTSVCVPRELGHLTDAEFRDLLAACPSLKHLRVQSLVLEEQHGGEHSSLEQLILHNWEWGMADTLSRLPSTPKVLDVSLSCIVDVSLVSDAHAVAAAMARVNLCHRIFLRLCCPGTLNWDSNTISNLKGLCPLLQAMQPTMVEVDRARICGPLLEALSPVGMECLVFDDCTWAPGVAADFWSLVPSTKEVRFVGYTEDGLMLCQDQVALVCTTAARPVTVQLMTTDEIIQQHIQRAVQVAGKEHLVTLEM